MESVSDAELKNMTQEERVTALGMRTEALSGKSLYIEFDPDAEERFTYPWAPDVDYNKRTELDTDNMTTTEVNSNIRALMAEGYGTIVLKIRAEALAWCRYPQPTKPYNRRFLRVFWSRFDRWAQCADQRSRWLVVWREHDGWYSCNRKKCRFNFWRSY